MLYNLGLTENEQPVRLPVVILIKLGAHE